MNKKKDKGNVIFLIFPVIFLFLFLLNGSVFFFSNCKSEYVKTTDIYGQTELYEFSDFRSQQKLFFELKDLPVEQTLNILAKRKEKNKEYQEAITYVNGGRFYGSSSGRTILEQREWANQKYNEYREQNHLAEADLEKVLETVKREYSILLKVESLFQKSMNYPDYIKYIMDSADALIKADMFLTNASWFRRNVLKCEKDYLPLTKLTVEPVLENGLILLVNERLTEIFAALLAISFAVISFLLFRKKADRHLYEQSRVFLLSGVSLVMGVILLYLSDFFMIQKTYGLPTAKTAIQSISTFRSSPYELSVASLLVILLFFKLLFFFSVYAVTLCICMKKSKKQMVFIPLFLIAAIGEFLLTFYRNDYSTITVFREINVFSALHMERFFSRYLNLNIFQQAISRIPPFLFFFLVYFLFLLMFLRKRIKSFYVQRINQTEQEYFEQINQKYTETRQIWHDIHNHLQAVSMLMENGDQEGARKYLHEMTEELDQTILPAKTGANALDALLYRKISDAKERRMNVRLQFDCSLKQVVISDYDLCSIFGNMLDNALEAMQKVREAKGTFEKELCCTLSMRRQNTMLYINCSNPYECEPEQSGNRILSTKPDAKRHGFGLKRIESLCTKHNGQMKISMENKVFCIELLLNAWN